MRSVTRRSMLQRAYGLLIVAATAPALAACGQPAPAEPSKPAGAAPAKPASAPAAAPAAAPPAAKAGSIEIVYLNQSRGQAKALGILAEQYSQKSGVKVTIDSPGPIDYPKKLQAASQANTMPDAYYAIGPADMAPYFKAGFALNLAPEMDKGWKANFSPQMLNPITWREGNSLGVPAGIYQAPWEANSYAVIFNPAHFEKAKLDPAKPPATMTDFVAALKALKAAGIGPFSMADSFIPTFIQGYVSNWLTDDEIDATQGGKAPWSADPYKKTLALLVELRDAGVIFNNALDRPNPDIEKSFFNVQEIATFYTGVFSIPVQVTTAPNFTAYSAFGLPKAPDAKHDPRTFGGPGKNGVINPKGKNVDETLKFVKWLTDKEAAAVFMDEVPLVPANPQAVDPAKIKPQLAAFAKEMAKIQAVSTPRTGPVNEAFVKGVQAMLLKEKTPDQVLKDAETAQKG
jgi:ABC-type glycerol-3-phosphate transport system substrate-binding protein